MAEKIVYKHLINYNRDSCRFVYLNRWPPNAVCVLLPPLIANTNSKTYLIDTCLQSLNCVLDLRVVETPFEGNSTASSGFDSDIRLLNTVIIERCLFPCHILSAYMTFKKGL